MARANRRFGKNSVGTKSFVEKINEKLGARAIGRGVVAAADAYELNEPEGSG